MFEIWSSTFCDTDHGHRVQDIRIHHRRPLLPTPMDPHHHRPHLHPAADFGRKEEGEERDARNKRDPEVMGRSRRLHAYPQRAFGQWAEKLDACLGFVRALPRFADTLHSQNQSRPNCTGKSTLIYMRSWFYVLFTVLTIQSIFLKTTGTGFKQF